MQSKALLVGINKYPDPANALRGCINDILDIEYFISEKNKKYATKNIKKLTNEAATKKGILRQIQWLIEGAEAGDQLLFHYSGHGAQVPSANPALEKDKLDEIICPYDFNGTAETAISDKEFASLFASIPNGVHFVWISDSCHAEDLSRDLKTEAGNTYRYFNGLNSARAKIATTPLIKSALNGALLSACASHELSADAYINNRFNGAFTHYLVANLLAYGETKNMRSLIQLVNKDLLKNGYDQNPSTEGLLANQYFFK